MPMDIILDIGDLTNSGTSFSHPASYFPETNLQPKIPETLVDFSADNESIIYGKGSNYVDINITAELQEISTILNDSCNLLTCPSVNVTTEGNEFTDTRNWMFLLLCLLVVAGGLGNILVCLAICLERRLQNVTNYFLLSLAVADLLVCVAVMPFGILDGFLGHWPFDWRICSIWVSCDVLSCSSSIMHMCFISLGRYLGIRNPLKTRSSSKKVVIVKIVLVWLFSMVITSPITVLAMVDPRNIQPTPNGCAINNRFFFVFGSMTAFYIPMVIMVITYVLTVRLLQRKAKFLADKPTRRVPFIRRGRRSSPDSSDGGSNGTSTRNGDLQQQSSSTCQKCSRCQSAEAMCGDSREMLHPQNRTTESQGFVRIRVGRQSGHEQHNRSIGQQSQQLVVPGMVRTVGTNQVINEQKATKVLGIVFFSFVICWTPFFILNLLFAFMDPDDLPSPYLATTFLWLGYVSSTINPIIYTVFNKTFKRAFWKLLTCKCHFTRHVSLHSTNDLATWAFRSATNYTTKSGSPPDMFQESMC